MSIMSIDCWLVNRWPASLTLVAIVKDSTAGIQDGHCADASTKDRLFQTAMGHFPTRLHRAVI